jgi:WD40 repeat protein
LWDAATGKILHRLSGHAQSITAVAFTPDGRRLASASYDGTVRLWDVATGRLKHVLRGHSGWVVTIAVAPDGKTLASGGHDGKTLLWSTDSGRLQAELPRLTDVSALAFSRSQPSRPGVILLARAGTGRGRSAAPFSVVEEWSLSAATPGRHKRLHSVTGLDRDTSAIAYIPGGRTLAVSGVTTRTGRAIDGRVSFWDLATGRNLRNMDVPCGVEKFAISPDGRSMATASLNQNIKLWKLEGK